MPRPPKLNGAPVRQFFLYLVQQRANAAHQWAGGKLTFSALENLTATQAQALARGRALASGKPLVVRTFDRAQADGAVAVEQFVRVYEGGTDSNVIADIACGPSSRAAKPNGAAAASRTKAPTAWDAVGMGDEVEFRPAAGVNLPARRGKVWAMVRSEVSVTVFLRRGEEAHGSAWRKAPASSDRQPLRSDQGALTIVRAAPRVTVPAKVNGATAARAKVTGGRYRVAGVDQTFKSPAAAVRYAEGVAEMVGPAAWSWNDGQLYVYDLQAERKVAMWVKGAGHYFERVPAP